MLCLKGVSHKDGSAHLQKSSAFHKTEVLKLHITHKSWDHSHIAEIKLMALLEQTAGLE